MFLRTIKCDDFLHVNFDDETARVQCSHQSTAPRRSRRRRRIFGRAAAAEKFDRRAERRRPRKFWAAPAQIGGSCINTTISVVAVTNLHVLW